MSPEALILGLVWSNSLHSLLALAIGFAFAGALANGYQALTAEPASFSLLEQGERLRALASVLLLIFVAPFIIMRSIVVRRVERPSFAFVMIATVVAGFWSLMSGTVVVMALKTLHVLSA